MEVDYIGGDLPYSFFLTDKATGNAIALSSINWIEVIVRLKGSIKKKYRWPIASAPFELALEGPAAEDNEIILPISKADSADWDPGQITLAVDVNFDSATYPVTGQTASFLLTGRELIKR